MQSMAAVSQLRGLPSLGTQSSGLFGDAKASNLSFSSPRPEVLSYRTTVVRASFSGFNGTNAPVPPRGNEPSMFQNAPVPPSPPPPPPPPSSQGGGSFANELNRPSPVPPGAPGAPGAARPPGLSGGVGLNFPGNQIPGLPGSPRPKPGTPRPYDPTKQKSKVMEWLTPPPPPTELLQREHFRLSPNCNCTIYFGDLSKWYVDGKSDAVIAPSNKRLNTGPAVNAVLFKAAGSRLLDATQRLPDVAPQGIKAEVGDAISTRAFNLPVFRVIHTVGPVYKKNDQTHIRESDESLIKAYKSALGIAKKENLVYLAFPPLSCRIYGYPYSEGAEVALKTLKENCEGFAQIDIVIRNIEGYEAFIDEANKVLEVIKEKKVIKLPPRNPGASEPAAPPAAAPPPAEAPAAATVAAEVLPPVDIPPKSPAPPEANPVPSLEEEAPAPPPHPVAPAPVPSVQSSTGAPPAPPSPPPHQTPPASAPGFGTIPSPPVPGFSQPPPPPSGPPPFKSPYSQGAPQFSSAQANFQSGATPPPPPRPPFQNAPQSNQFQPGAPQFQGFQPPYQQQHQPPPAPGFQQYNQRPPPPPGFQQYNQPPPPPPPPMSPYSAQYQGNSPPPPPPPPPPSPAFQQHAPQFQQSPPFQQQYPPASPPPPPPAPPAPAAAGVEQEAPRPLPPHQQKYVPPPPPPPPESKPIPPSERVSPFPPPNRAPRPPSSPTSTYEQPLF